MKRRGFPLRRWDWSRCTRKRADKDHRRRRLAKRQKAHLRAIKSAAALRQIMYGSRVKQR
jgi:hypothetical protein